jgi:hypothetical protein
MENMLVRFIPTDRSSKHGWAGNKPALCFRGEKKAHCVIIKEAEIGTVDLPIDVVEKSQIVPDAMGQALGIPYPPAKFVKRILETGKFITPEARALIRSLNGKKVALPVAPKQRKLATRPEKAPLKTAGAELIIALAAEWKLPTPKLRRYLRGQGLHAPYTDEKTVRAALKKLKKGGK